MSRIVLIVDDNEELLDFWKANLTPAGFNVYTTTAALESVTKAQILKPDIIILDYNMPDASGAEVYEQLQKSPETASIPVIFLSGIISGLIKRQVPESDKVRFLKKPCSWAEFQKCFNELLGIKPPD